MVKGKVRSLRAGAAALAAAGLAVSFALAGGGAANAAGGGGGSTPPWYSQYNSSNAPVGGITFYNAQGQVVTGGSITASGLAAYAVADTADPLAPHLKGTLFMYTPVSGENPLTWTGAQLSLSTSYPNTSAPAPISGTTNPVETNEGGDTDSTIQSYINDIPNTDTSTTDGYGGNYDVRLRVSGGTGGDTTEFWDAVISVSVTGATSTDPGGTGGTWTIDYPDYTQNTTTALTANPTTETTSAPITLTATVAPAADAVGTVSFWNTSTTPPTQVGATQTVSATDATASVSATPPTGTTPYEAIFTPAIPDSPFSSSGTIPSFDEGSSDSLSYLVGTVPTSTTTTLTASPATSVQQGSSATLTATVAATSGSTIPAGTVQFEENGADVSTPQTVNSSTGVAALTTTQLLPSAPSGAALTAVFTPTDSSSFSTSTGSLSYTVNPVAVTPTISGTARVGQKVTCSEGTLDPGVTASYIWQVGTTKVGSGATLTIPASVYNKELTCEATVSDGGGPTSSATSASVKVGLGNAPTALKKHGPTLSGKHEVGKKETVNPGKWSQKVTFTYQWLLNGKVIKHATKSTFTPSKSDKGKKLSCRVTAHATGYANGSATTSSVKVSS